MLEPDRILTAILDAERRVTAAVEKIGKDLAFQLDRHDEKAAEAIAEMHLHHERMLTLNRNMARSLRVLAKTAMRAQKILPNGKQAAIAKSLEWSLRVIYILVGLLGALWLGPHAIQSIAP